MVFAFVFGQVLPHHHPDQMSHESQMSRIAFWMCSLNIFFSQVINCLKGQENIARGTTDPEIDSVTWIKFSNNMDLLHLL